MWCSVLSLFLLYINIGKIEVGKQLFTWLSLVVSLVASFFAVLFFH